MVLHSVAVLRRRSARGDQGFTMIEVMAALTLVAVAMVAVTSVFFSSLRTSSISSFRSAAAALATRETEAIHGVKYSNVGFYSGQAGYTATFEGAPTVTLGAGNPAGLTLVPTASVTIGTKTYAVTRHLTWADALDNAGNTLSQAYKKTTVFVRWSDQGRSHEVRQDSIFYPGGQDAYAGPAGSTTTTTTGPSSPGVPGAPTGLTATVPAAPDGETRVSLAWSAPTTGAAVDHYRVEASDDPTFGTGVVNGLTSATSYTVSGLASNTPYYFRVFAISTVSPDESGASAASNTSNGTTLSPAAATCSVISMVLSSPADGGANRKTNGDLDEDIQVTLNLTSACGATTYAAKVSFTDGTPNPALASGVNPKTFSGSATTRTVTWARNSAGWTAGDHQIVLTDGTGTPITPSAFVLVRVCNRGVTCP